MNVGELLIDKYEIVQEIKRGGFGIIYRGVDTLHGKTVAIKTIDPQLLGEARYIDMFQREATSVASLNHQNIVQIHDVSRGDSGQLFIAMEYIDGPDLMSLLHACSKNGKGLPTYLAVHILAEVCNGLDYAHNLRDEASNEPLNLVHQDMSPANIMITRTGQIKIIDFGLANLQNLTAGKAGEVKVQGKIHYMAPEQIQRNAIIDRRADIFALGVILFEALTGERLIRASNMQEAVETILTGAWDLSPLAGADIPEKLQETVRRALQHKPKNRYPTANLMYRDLMHYLILNAPAADYTNDLAQFMSKIEVEKFEEPSLQFNNGHGPHGGVSSTTETEPEAESGDNGQHQSQAERSVSDEQNSDADETQAQSEEESFPLNDETLESLAEKISSINPEADIEVTDGDQDTADDYYSFVEDGDEDAQRTIIDVVRLSARTHKKAITLTLLSLVAGLLGFIVIDTFTRMTSFGAEIYDFLFPPAIKITSVPPGAQVYLDDVLLPERTPLSLAEIAPGVHKLMFDLPEFETVVKSINVPSRGDISIPGEARRHASQPYIFKFKSQLDLASTPSGADIVIDGVHVNQKTPATVYWEVSDAPVEVAMAFEGLPTLSGLRIHTTESRFTLDDHRLWDAKQPVEGKSHFVIEGIFHQNITVSSNPRGAEIYLDDNAKPVGITGLNGSLLLPIGSHTIQIKKEGYLPRIFTLDVTPKMDSQLRYDLLRTVRIFAKNTASEFDSDLGANLTLTNERTGRVEYQGETPAILKLRPYTYSAKFEMPGFESQTQEIAADAGSLVAKMLPLITTVVVSAVDAITNVPIQSAQIMMVTEEEPDTRQVLGITDSDGQLTDELKPGNYQIIIEKQGYQNQIKNLRIRATDRDYQLTFRLSAYR